MAYNWQQNDWPHFTYNLNGAENDLLLLAEKIGHVGGMMKGLPEEGQLEVAIELMISEAVKTSAIEGEFLSRHDIMSSIKNNLGLHETLLQVNDKKANGIGKLMVEVRKTYKNTLTQEQLLNWHTMLLGESGTKVTVGAWRTHATPMQVISRSVGKERIHFEAPPSHLVPEEMEKFIAWFNETCPGGSREIKSAPVRSAIAHLYFETIHPFEDGNGRIGRAIAEKALSQGVGRPVLLSLSNTIEANKNAYYEALQKAQKANEITAWLHYFIKTVLHAQTQAENEIEFTLKKAKFFDIYKNMLNSRQLIIIKRMFDEGAGGFKGGMNARKYCSLTRASKATATRDMQDLTEKGIFIPLGDGKGRSTSYQVNI